MRQIIIKNGYLLSQVDGYHFEKKDILIKDGIIENISDYIFASNATIIDASNNIVTPGIIDSHAHIFTDDIASGIDIDQIGINSGVSTVIDAGSAGPDNVSDLKQSLKDKKTNSYALLNVATRGRKYDGELADSQAIDEEKIVKALNQETDFILGLKARASQTAVKNQGIKPIIEAQKIAQRYNYPLMIHFGNNPPLLEEILLVTDKKTVLTHAFHGKNNHILKNIHTQDLLKKRQKLGLKLDLGHGARSFNKDIFLEAQKLGINVDMISTNLNQENQIAVKSMFETMNKMLNLNLELTEVIDKVTYQPAQFYQLRGKGRLKVGYDADISIAEFKIGQYRLFDSQDNRINIVRRYRPLYTFVSHNKNTIIKKNK